MKSFGRGNGSRSANASHVIAPGLFVPVSAASRQDQPMLSDMGVWFAMAPPRQRFEDDWASGGHFPRAARRVLEQEPRFADFTVVMGFAEAEVPGVTVLLRAHGHLVMLRVIDIEEDGMLDLAMKIEDTRAHAEQFCVTEAVLLMHAPAERDRAAYAAILAAAGGIDARESTLHRWPGDDSPLLFVGCIAAHE